MKDEWNKDPALWEQRSLIAKLEAMRKWFCTGPCGQSNDVLGTRSSLDAVIREAIEYIRERGEK